MPEMHGRTPTLRSPLSPPASRSGAGRRRRWWEPRSRSDGPPMLAAVKAAPSEDHLGRCERDNDGNLERIEVALKPAKQDVIAAIAARRGELRARVQLVKALLVMWVRRRGRDGCLVGQFADGDHCGVEG